jgi:hypothetical protein
LAFRLNLIAGCRAGGLGDGSTDRCWVDPRVFAAQPGDDVIEGFVLGGLGHLSSHGCVCFGSLSGNYRVLLP